MSDEQMEQQPLKAALSPDQSLAAVVLPSSSVAARRVIQVYDVTTNQVSLQTTLTTDSTTFLERILFCGNHHVIALAANHQKVLVWDLKRGGNVAHILDGGSKHCLYWDLATSQDSFYLLVTLGASSGNSKKKDSDGDKEEGVQKLQVHQYDPTSGKLLRKVKCGKTSSDGIVDNDNSLLDCELGLALYTSPTDNNKVQLLVRNGSGHSKEAFRILDAETGSKIAKAKHDSKTNAGGGGGKGLVMVTNTLVAVPRMTSVALYDLVTHKWIKSIQAATATSNNPSVQPFRRQDYNDDNLIMFLVDQALYHYSPLSHDSKSKSVAPQRIANIHSGDSSVALLPRSNYRITAILHNPTYARKSQSSSLSNLQIQMIDCSHLGDDESKDELEDKKSKPSDIHIQWQASDEEVRSSDGADKSGSTAGSSSDRKRNAITVLGPGQAGKESVTVSERKAHKKRKLSSDDANDGDKAKDTDVLMTDDLAEDAEDPSTGMTIADRLKKLTQVMDEDDDDDEDSDEEDKVTKQSQITFTPKRATTESLTELLTQALQGGDEGLLELALVVRDKGIIQKTIKGLSSQCVDRLMAKLTTRLASKPQRADQFAFWLSHLLQSGRVQKTSRLQPLRNLLEERVESFPHLLRLEGRLSMVMPGPNDPPESSLTNY